MEVKIKDFIFCDDIRSEIGRKFSIMGIYSDKIRIKTKAQKLQKIRLPLSAFIKLSLASVANGKEFIFDIDISFEEVKVAKLEGELNFGDENFLTLPINRFEMIVEKQGVVKFNLVIKDKGGNAILNHEEALEVVIEESSSLPE